MDSQRLCQIPMHPRGFAGSRNVGPKEYSGQHDAVLFAGASRCRICRNTYKAVDAKGKPLKPIPCRELDLNLPWDTFDLAHELTTKGIQKFVADYQSTLRGSA
jgi:hypothetical protein